MAGSIQMQPMVKTIATFLPKEHIDKMREMGYSFRELLGEGGYGAAFRCQFTRVDPQTRQIVVEPFAAKVVQIPYRPDLRQRRPQEVRQLGRNQEIRINYRMKGKLVEESVMWRRIEPQIPPHMIENPMKKHEKTVMRRNAENIETELQAMTRAEHLNVIKIENTIRFYDNYSSNPFMSSVVIFMELADGGDLVHYLSGKICSEDECKQMMAQISCGVEHIHSRGIAHMDLKPANILVFNSHQNPIFKITDFGLSLFFDPGVTPEVKENLLRGTPLYRCPSLVIQEIEIRSGRRTEFHYDPTKVDVWALGVIILYIMFGYAKVRVFYDQVRPPQQTYSNTFLRLLRTQKHSQLLKDLMQQILVEEQDKRIDIKQFCEHKWINDAIVAHKAGITVT